MGGYFSRVRESSRLYQGIAAVAMAATLTTGCLARKPGSTTTDHEKVRMVLCEDPTIKRERGQFNDEYSRADAIFTGGSEGYCSQESPNGLHKYVISGPYWYIKQFESFKRGDAVKLDCVDVGKAPYAQTECVSAEKMKPPKELREPKAPKQRH